MRAAVLVMAVLLISSCVAGPQVSQRALDFSTVGFYGTWLPIGDFGFLKFSYSKPEHTRRLAVYSTLLRQAASAGQKVILGLYTFDRVSHSRPIEEYVANTNALLEALPRDLIYAVCPSEENVTWNNGLKVLNALYECVHGRWGLRCYQWLTMPDPPHGKLKADGWILDAYGMRRERFRRHLAKFVVTGKPVVVCVNATPPSARHAAEKILPGAEGSAAEEQMEVCEEFNVPVFFYAVDRKFGSVWAWMRDDDEETVACRRWVMSWIERAHKQRERTGPAASADYMEARPMEVCGGKDNRFAVNYDFASASFLDYAGVEGLTRLQWDGIAETLRVSGPTLSQTINAAGKGGSEHQISRRLGPPLRPRLVVLYWHIVSPLNIVALKASAKVKLEGRGATARVWVGGDLIHRQVAQRVLPRGVEELRLEQAMPEDWRGQEAWVGVEFEAPRGGVVVVSQVEISGQTEPPADKSVRLSLGPEVAVVYRDDFKSPKLIHFSEVDRPDELRWRPGAWYITGRKGGPNRVRIRIHFVADKPIADGEVRVGALAWTKAHAARIICALSADGERALVQRDTAKLPQDKKYHRFVGTISLPFSEAAGIKGRRDFWLVIEMVNGSGVKAGPSNLLNFIEVRASGGRAK